MPPIPPDAATLRQIADALGLDLSDEDIASYGRYAAFTMASYARLDRMAEMVPPVARPRTPGRRPGPGENPHNAWYMLTDIAGAADGPLAGKRVAIKDTIALAGVPMMDGASTLEGYVPEFDATVVSRILDAGATIAGKAACEYFSYSSGSHTSATGMVQNPRKPGYAAGGSSSGSAALVAAGAVGLALGGDQAGSIRIPSAHCGVYGLKPTWGLVPYSGIISSEHNVDHVGPITATVADNALLLETIAGDDGIDLRRASAAPRVERYTDALAQGVAGLRIGVLEEGFAWPSMMPPIVRSVRAGAARLAKLGAAVESISVPIHTDGVAIWLAFALEGYFVNMMSGNGFGTNHGGLYWTSLNDRHASWRLRARELPDNLKLGIVLGAYMRERHFGHYYVKAMNLTRRLAAAYDEALTRYDLLLMPTVLSCATPLPSDPDRETVIDLAFANIENTSPFNLSHHPAMSLPCGHIDGCPIGLMLIGRHYDEATIYRAAQAFSQSFDWRSAAAPMPGRGAAPRRAKRRGRASGTRPAKRSGRRRGAP